MRLAHPEIETVFAWPCRAVPVLVIEHQQLFRRILTDLYLATQGADTAVVLSVDDKPVNAAKYVQLMTDFLSFELNRKPLLNKVCAALERTAMSEEHYHETQVLLSTLEARLEDWAFGFPCDIVAANVSVSALLKAVGITLREEYDTEQGEAEKVIDYMELVREFDGDKLFVTVNMRSWFSDDVIADFMQTVVSHEYSVLMIECVSHPLLEQETRTTVDRDLCEF